MPLKKREFKLQARRSTAGFRIIRCQPKHLAPASLARAQMLGTVTPGLLPASPAPVAQFPAPVAPPAPTPRRGIDASVGGTVTPRWKGEAIGRGGAMVVG